MRLSPIFLGFFIFLALAVTAPVSGRDVVVPKNGKMFVLTIGVNQYADSFWPVLRWAEEDANRLAKAIGKGTGKEVVTKVLLGLDATRAKVVDELSRLIKVVGTDDVLVVYFSGHGTLGAAHLEPMIVLRDSRHDKLESSTLSHETLRGQIDKIAARHKVVILATCHSGLGKSRLAPEAQQALSSIKGSVVPVAAPSEGTIMLSAAARGETAREDDRLKGDLYTNHFLQGLLTGDRNGDGAVSALEAHDFARERTMAASKNQQRPTAEVKTIGDGDTALVGQVRRPGSPVLIGYEESFANLAGAVRGKGDVTFPGAIVLEAGTNVVRIFQSETKEEVAAYSVHASAGESITLSELFKPPPYNIRGGLGFFQFKDQSARRVSSEPIFLGFVEGGARFAAFAIGLTIESATSVKRTEFGIQMMLEKSAVLGLRMGSVLDLGKFSLETGALYQRSNWELILRDSDGGDQLSYRAASNAVGVYGRGALTLARGYFLSLDANLLWEKVNFGEAGNLSAARQEFLFGLGWAFGGKGVRL